MAEENKVPQVELDTDGVNDINVDVPEAKEPDESFAQKETVNDVVIPSVDIDAVLI